MILILNLSVPDMYDVLSVGWLVTYEVKSGNLTVQDLHVDLSGCLLVILKVNLAVPDM